MSGVAAKQPVRSEISTGAGLAIAGAWLGGSAVTAILVLVVFVWSEPIPSQDVETIGAVGGMFLILLLASPMIAAYSVTKLILGKD